MTLTKRNLISFIAGLSLLITTGCDNNETATLPEEGTPANVGEINVYSSRHYDTDDALYDDFTEQTGIEVNVIEGEAAELIERIQSEGANSPADVLITVDVGNLWRAQEAGILQPISSESLTAGIPENLRSPEGYWFGLTKRARVIVYNTDQVNPEELTTYEDLADPKWQGRFCVRSSENIYNQSLVASKVAEKGAEATEQWAKGLVSNFAREPEGNDTAQIKAVAAGECDLALVNHYYVARLKQSQDPADQEVASKVAVFFPNQNAGGTHINISGAGVAANSPNQENAIAFIEYLATPEAQKVFASDNNEFPVVAGVEPAPAVKEFGEFQASDLNVAAYGEKNAEAVQLMDRAGWK